MSSTDDSTDNIPKTVKGEPIIYDGNRGAADGFLRMLWKYLKGKNKFQLLFDQRAVPMQNGKVACESHTDVKFLNRANGYVDPVVPKDEKKVFTICPATPERLARANAERATPMKELPLVDEISDADAKMYVYAPHLVTAAKHELGNIIALCISGCDEGAELVSDADGDGLVMLQTIMEWAKDPSLEERGVITGRFNKHATKGIEGELSLASLTEFLSTYDKLMLNMPKEEHPTTTTQIQMITNFALKDTEAKPLYKLEIKNKAPTSRADAVKILKDILRSRVFEAELIDGPAVKATGPILHAGLTTPPVPPPPVAEAQIETTAEAVLAFMKKDPKKFGKFLRDKPDKRKAPDDNRDADGRVKAWKPHLGLCKH